MTSYMQIDWCICGEKACSRVCRRSVWEVVKTMVVLGSPKYYGPYYTGNPRRDHKFDNLPLLRICQGAFLDRMSQSGFLSRNPMGSYVLGKGP